MRQKRGDRLPGPLLAIKLPRLPGKTRLPGRPQKVTRVPGFGQKEHRLPGAANPGYPDYLILGTLRLAHDSAPPLTAFFSAVLLVLPPEGRAISARAPGSDALPAGPPLLRGRCALAPGAERSPDTVSQCVTRPGARPRRSDLPMYTSVRESFPLLGGSIALCS